MIVFVSLFTLFHGGLGWIRLGLRLRGSSEGDREREERLCIRSTAREDD